MGREVGLDSGSTLIPPTNIERHSHKHIVALSTAQSVPPSVPPIGPPIVRRGRSRTERQLENGTITNQHDDGLAQSESIPARAIERPTVGLVPSTAMATVQDTAQEC